MPAFNAQKRTLEPIALDVITTTFGADATASSAVRYEADRGKAVKLIGYVKHGLCAAGDEIEGFIDSVSSGSTYNDGFTAGGVAQRGDHWAEIGAGQGATPAVVGDYVVADDQAVFGTAGAALVKTGAPTKYLWRIVRVDGDGLAGAKVLLQRA